MGHWRVWKREPYGFEPWSIGFIQPAYHTSNVNKTNFRKILEKKLTFLLLINPKCFWNRVFFSNSNCPRGNRIIPASTPEANLDEGQNYAVSFIKSLFYFGKLLQCLLSNTYSAKLSFQNVICKIGFKPSKQNDHYW